MKKLLKWVKKESGRLEKDHGRYPDQDKQIFARTIKLGEEFGELCQEVLFHSSRQRKSKMDKFKKENLPDEFADVLITTLLLAQEMNIDIEKALEDKIKKIDKRYEKSGVIISSGT